MIQQCAIASGQNEFRIPTYFSRIIFSKASSETHTFCKYLMYVNTVGEMCNIAKSNHYALRVCCNIQLCYILQML